MASFPCRRSRAETTATAVLLKFLPAHDFRVGTSVNLLCKTFRWRREPWSLGFTAGDGELLPEESLWGAVDMEGGKARCIQWRVRAMDRHVAELDFRPSGVPALLQITDCDE